jgi:hypothetical protein|uniref:Uncharacterized protein n=1 Tax=Picea glauca TaxID=3330 RepID=A0A101M4X4_PICGL|nr:hypothetical protein ABT39_MTgene992 [Picea glauca]QHR90896.1 hypothetical protein Q903MT_gene4923 [Picea sitchensis]
MNYAISRSPITGYGTRDSTIASARAIGIDTTTEMGPATAPFPLAFAAAGSINERSKWIFYIHRCSGSVLASATLAYDFDAPISTAAPASIVFALGTALGAASMA